MTYFFKPTSEIQKDGLWMIEKIEREIYPNPQFLRILEEFVQEFQKFSELPENEGLHYSDRFHRFFDGFFPKIENEIPAEIDKSSFRYALRTKGDNLLNPERKITKTQNYVNQVFETS